MKTSYTKCSLFLSLIFFFASCEKENDLSTNAPSGKTDAGLTKGKSKNEKSGGLSYEIIKSYNDSITQGVEPPDKTTILGLNHIESALNYELGDVERAGEITEVLSVEADLEISEDGQGNQIIKGEDALAFYNSISTEISTAVANSDIATEYGEDSVFISAIDIHTDTSFSTGLIVPTVTVISHKPTFLTDPCNSDYGWKALDQLGRCNGTMLGRDAAMELERILNSQYGNCAESFCMGYNTWNVITHITTGFQTANVWNGFDESDCLTKSAINNTWVPGAKTEGTNFLASRPPLTGNRIDIIDYQVGKRGSGGIPVLPGVAHELTVQTADFWCPPFP